MPHTIRCSVRIKIKLNAKHGVSLDEVNECFINRNGRFLQDTRAEHVTIPPTLWFIAETNHRRTLKIVFVIEADNTITLKTAYAPNPKEQEIYAKYAQ